MARVNILKQIKSGQKWSLVSIPRDHQGRYQWKELPEGRYFIEWYEQGKRRRRAAGATASEALEKARERKHILEGRALGLEEQKKNEEEADSTPLHLGIRRYLEITEGLKKPNTLRKYKAVLERFLDFFPNKSTAQDISTEDLNQFMVFLKKKHGLGNNTIVHNMIIVAQFLKRQGRPNLTRKLELPEPSKILPREYTDEELAAFLAACSERERTLFLTFLLTGFREKEVVHLWWEDVNFKLKTIKVTSKPDLEFSPKRWEEREVPVPEQLTKRLADHPHFQESKFIFPSPRGNRELHMLDHCKEIARRAKLDPDRFNLRKFRSTYATRMLRAGFDVRTVQHWMGHKSLETTMRYLVPARDIRDKLDKVQIAGILEEL